MSARDERAGRVFVVFDGSPACFACCAMSPDSRRTVLWAPPGFAGGAELMTHAARLLDLGDTVSRDAGERVPDHPGPLGETRMLLLALERAASLGCSRVVWPVVCGPDLDAMTAAAELAELVTRIGWIAFPKVSPRVETPLADLTPAQVADLLEDLRVPMELLSAPASG